MNKVTIVVGSHRNESESLKIGKMMAGKLEAHQGCNAVELLNLADMELPFWQEQYTAEESQAIEGVRGQLQSADAFVIISPEWNGMVPAALKNLFLLYSAPEFAHKPALIASVSASIGGSYPINELRTSSYKNSRICYIPEHLIFRDVGSIFNQDGEVNQDAQTYMSDRTDFCLDYLMLYSDALKKVRQDQPHDARFGNGM